MQTPDFFVVGAPKCGTTAMDEYLRQHPEIFVPPRKELHFFGRDLRFLKGPRLSRETYLSHFVRSENARCVGEASVWYLYSTTAAEEIKQFCPHAKIIIMLRNPVDMMYALHSQFLYECNEEIIDFEAALAVEGERRRGRCLPPGIYFREGLYYREVASYAPQVARYLDVFGRDNVHIIDFDDLKEHPPDVYLRVLQFLGVDPQFRPEFRIVNANKAVRSRSLQFFLNNPPPPVLAASRMLIPTPIRHALVETAKRLNSKQAPRITLSPALRQRLIREMRLQIDILSRLLERDFSSWCRDTGVAAPVASALDDKDKLVGSGAYESHLLS